MSFLLTKKIVAVANAIATNEGKILILKRSAKSKYAPGFWQLPGGRLEFGETPMEALEREIKEETGGIFVPSSERVVCVNSHVIEIKGDEFQLLTIVYEGMIDGSITISEEHSEFRWIAVDDVLNLNNLEDGTRQILNSWNESK
ncbi:MAG: NUDIX domain-containing protein [Candidatus Marsarchaeota archaeon]|nr:NUDIX domain-containing protein [Candidatus Marsarchaeota archaeon]